MQRNRGKQQNGKDEISSRKLEIPRNISCKDGDNKGQKRYDLKEAEDIKKRCQEHKEDLEKKDLHDPDNHHGVITHPEPYILKCEVKWSLGSVTKNKVSGGDEIQLNYYKS